MNHRCRQQLRYTIPLAQAASSISIGNPTLRNHKHPRFLISIELGVRATNHCNINRFNASKFFSFDSENNPGHRIKYSENREKHIMKPSAAVTKIVATDPSILATPKVSASFSRGFLSKEGDDNTNNDNTGVRGNRNHRTISHVTDRENRSLKHHHFSNSNFLTKEKRKSEAFESDVFNGNSNLDGKVLESHVPDLGILSKSRRLVPIQNDVFANPERPKSLLFDSFNVMDRDRTSFYSICDADSDDGYRCSRCDTDSQKGTVGSFDCEKSSCYVVDSRCPGNRISVCRYDSMERSFEDEISDNAFMPYTTERCRRLETRLFKDNRERLPGEEWSWDFSYCLRYKITSDPSFLDDRDGDNVEDNISLNTCEMEVDGIACTACDLQAVEALDPSSNNGSRKAKFCASFD